MKKGKESKPHIGIYGRRNSGKSSLINILSGQDIAIVSDEPGTTTDPVKRSYEIVNFGPVIFIDTAGIDDVGNLGEKRIAKTNDTISKVDLAILVFTDNIFSDFEKSLIEAFKSFDTPYIIVHNKSDIYASTKETRDYLSNITGKKILDFSTVNPHNLSELVDLIRISIPESSYIIPSLLGDLISYGDIVLLITPIDSEAPAGRLILPQVQAIRDILDNDSVAIVLKEREVDSFLRRTGVKPALVITDSQIFNKAAAMIPEDIPLTSFSIALARNKGDFSSYLKGTPKISELNDGDRILILESCSHQQSCDDIGRVKIPRWLSSFTGKNLIFDVVPGLDNLPLGINKYALVIQCGGCMITHKQLKNRLKSAIDAGIPVTNYGMAISWVMGIYNRAIKPFVTDSMNETTYL